MTILIGRCRVGKTTLVFQAFSKDKFTLIIEEFGKRLVICEVKLSEKRLNHNVLVGKSQKLIEKYKGYEVEYLLLSLRDL